MSSQYGELRPTNSWDRSGSLGHPCKFQRVSRLGSVTARHSSNGRQPNFEALNRGRHLYSARRPSRWALAHISSSVWFAPIVHCRYAAIKNSASTALHCLHTHTHTQTHTHILTIQVNNSGIVSCIVSSERSVKLPYDVMPFLPCYVALGTTGRCGSEPKK